MGEKRDLPKRIEKRVVRLLDQFRSETVARAIAYSHKRSAYHDINVQRIPLGRAWSVAEIGNHIVFASRLGRLGYLSISPAGVRVANLKLDVPMQLDALRASSIGRNELFDISQFRTTDLLSVDVSANKSELYAAYMRFESNCFRPVVSRASITVSDQELTADASGWVEIFQARDCVSPKDVGVYFVGSQAGGRLIQLDQDRLALSIGDYQFDGVYSDKAYSMDPSSDLGKIIEINLKTGQSQIMVRGVRNPQGLVRTASGQIWETEHGPQGGDELNLIQEGKNYGWPAETYGMKYGGRPEPWPGQPFQAGEAYEKPRYAFVPSIGISNLIEVDPREFPRWTNSLIVASLRAGTLFVMRMEADRVVVSEPIKFEDERIRDLISLKSGRIAMVSDSGDIFVLSNADQAQDQAQPSFLSGMDTLLPRLSDEISPEKVSSAGIFAEHCSSCHSWFGKTLGGPSLDGIVNRPIASKEGYNYSRALVSARGQTWTYSKLRNFISDPEGVFPGTAMPSPNVPDEEIDGLIDFLGTRRAMPTQAETK